MPSNREHRLRITAIRARLAAATLARELPNTTPDVGGISPVREMLSTTQAEANPITVTPEARPANVEELGERLRLITSIRARMRDLNKELKSQNRNLSRVNNQLEEAKKKLEEENKNLKDETTTLTKERKSLTDETATLKKQRKNLSNKVNNIKMECKKLTKKIDTLKQESNNLNKINDILKREMGNVQDENKHLKGENKIRKRWNDYLERENMKLREEVRALYAKVAHVDRDHGKAPAKPETMSASEELATSGGNTAE